MATQASTGFRPTVIAWLNTFQSNVHRHTFQRKSGNTHRLVPAAFRMATQAAMGSAGLIPPQPKFRGSEILGGGG